MEFKTLALVKYPLPRVWQAMRDEMPRLSKHLDDIESITQTERTETPEMISIVNVWQAKPKLPDIIARHVDTSKFSWTDYAQWDERKMLCRWRIEPKAFTTHFGSSGETRFEPAMGGRGTRITFTGQAEVKISVVSDGVRKILEDTVLKSAMNFVQGVISKNFRKMADALAKHLESEAPTVTVGTHR